MFWDTLQTILAVALVLFAAAGVISLMGILVTLSIIRTGGYMTLGYKEDEENENNNNVTPAS